MKVIDIRTSLYFPGSILFIGVLLLVGSGALFIIKGLVGTIPLLFSAIIFTTHYRLRIDLDSKEYFEYLWILGFKNGEKGKFENIEYLFIKKKKVSQKMNSRASSTIIRSEVYDGYLKFSEENKIHVSTQSTKEKLMNQLSPIASVLNVKIVDYTEEAD